MKGKLVQELLLNIEMVLGLYPFFIWRGILKTNPLYQDNLGISYSYKIKLLAKAQ